jgi:hypothetical protein
MATRCDLLILAAALAFFTGCKAPRFAGSNRSSQDPIERLTSQMSAGWFEVHSHFTRVDLPPSTTPQEVAVTALGLGDYRIIKVRPAGIKGAKRDPIAVLLDDMHGGQLLVLALYVECGDGFWWTQVYEAN